MAAKIRRITRMYQTIENCMPMQNKAPFSLERTSEYLELYNQLKVSEKIMDRIGQFTIRLAVLTFAAMVFSQYAIYLLLGLYDK
jgi:hypothetical protein